MQPRRVQNDPAPRSIYATLALWFISLLCAFSPVRSAGACGSQLAVDMRQHVQIECCHDSRRIVIGEVQNRRVFFQVNADQDVLFKYWWIKAIAMLPSPTPAAQRLTESSRTSPAAKIPG